MNIKQAADLFDLTTDTLRYYERIGVVPPVTRNASGYRDYQTSDLNWIYLVKCLRDAGVSVESLIDFATLSQGDRNQSDQTAQKAILQEQLDRLEEKLQQLQKTKSLLQYKIDTYDDHIAKYVTNPKKQEVEPLWKQFEK
ncbi:MerR family transcriptional regulator [Lacticaseibacillus sp. N501-2]|uniref:MerR family transcriptional regulator n=1 Tax=Lacticaseibacillus salsurae TaxID=3367729 RepID=UPI0038B37A95